jgi:DNA repair exonuclease SbcCD nuclease subunit
MSRDIVVIHSSDLHVDHDYTARLHGGDGTAGLGCVLDAARAIGADLVLLVGDTFESHRVRHDVVDRAGERIRAAGVPVVLLPGNHDPALPDGLYRQSSLAAVENLHVLGVTHEDAVDLPHLDLEVWGRAHRDYGDMVPLAMVRPRRTRWQIALAHGHYDPAIDRSISPRPSWLINDTEIDATGADYVALGHWNRAVQVGQGSVPAYYSGSPEYAGTINVVRLTSLGRVEVTQLALDIPREVEPVYVP